MAGHACLYVGAVRVAVVAVCLLPCARLAAGFAFYRDRIPNGHVVQHPCDSNKTWSGVGHATDLGGTARNQFGLDFRAAGHNWTEALCNRDSDGDGWTNGEELGDPVCQWRPGDMTLSSDNVTHPGFRTPVEDYAFRASDANTLDCSTLFQRCLAFDEAEVRVLELRVPPGNESIVPAKETTYKNINFELPADQEYHAIGFEPILDNLNVIHHFILSACEFPVPVGRGYESFNVMEGCESTMYPWSFGIGPECLPDAAGVLFGKGRRRFVQLQLHWSNLQKRSGLTDTSGVRVHYTSRLRRYDMGTLWLGQQDLVIPPGQPSVVSASTCSEQCTKTLLPQGDIYLTTAFPHMHFLGKSMHVDHYSNGIRRRIMSENAYRYNSPKLYDYAPDFIRVQPGDTFHATCEFNSMSRNETTRWGFASTEEMCFAFVRYYPRSGELFCTQYQTVDLCYSQSRVEGPNCSVFGYMENVMITVNTAMEVCDNVLREVLKPLPSASPVCSDACGTHIARVLDAHRSPCLQTRHKREWNLLNGLIGGKLQILLAAERHCKVVGTVTSAASAPISLVTGVANALIAMSVSLCLSLHAV